MRKVIFVVGWCFMAYRPLSSKSYKTDAKSDMCVCVCVCVCVICKQIGCSNFLFKPVVLARLFAHS